MGKKLDEEFKQETISFLLAISVSVVCLYFGWVYKKGICKVT